MTADHGWNEAAFTASVTGRAWTYTEYDGGWEQCRDSAALRAIFRAETELGAVPDWAVAIVQRMLASPLPPCGHYLYPEPILQACRAIGARQCPELVLGCYTAGPERKALLAGYVLCLDAWRQRAPQEAALTELRRSTSPSRPWERILPAVWATLGPPTPHKDLLVDRLLHRLRWWLKVLIWPGDRRDRWQPDAYLGDVRGSAEYGCYGNPGFDDPYFAELHTRAAADLADRIRTEVPDGSRLLMLTESTWLCAPKAFRYLERLVLAIGGVGAARAPDYARQVLECQDTYPDLDAGRRWHVAFVVRLAAWLDGDAGAVPELGKPTPVTRWLAMLLHHRLEIYGQYTQYVGGPATGRPGTGPVT